MIGGFEYAWDGSELFGYAFAFGSDTIGIQGVGFWARELLVSGLEVRGEGFFDSRDIFRPVGCSSSYNDLDQE